MPRAEGYRGSRWQPPDWVTYCAGKKGVRGDVMSVEADARDASRAGRMRRPAVPGLVEARVEAGTGPPTRPAELLVAEKINARYDIWAAGGGPKGYTQVSNAGLRADPLTRLLLRDHDLEDKFGAGRVSGDGVRVRSMPVNRKSLFSGHPDGGGQRGSVVTKRALHDVLLPLHYYHHFTRCVATDGGRDDPVMQGGGLGDVG